MMILEKNEKRFIQKIAEVVSMSGGTPQFVQELKDQRPPVTDAFIEKIANEIGRLKGPVELSLITSWWYTLPDEEILEFLDNWINNCLSAGKKPVMSSF